MPLVLVGEPHPRQRDILIKMLATAGMRGCGI